MITITDGKERLILRENMLKKDKRGIIIKPPADYWYIELLIEKKRSKILRIIKKFPESGDEIKYYQNLERKEKNLILLDNDDYDEVKRLYNNMQIVDDNRKSTVIKAVSELFAYECYHNYCLEELDEMNCKDIYTDLELALQGYNECITYKDEIWERTKDILKKDYKVNLDDKFEGGRK